MLRVDRTGDRRKVGVQRELFRQDPGGRAGGDGRFVICGTTTTEQLRIRATSVGDVGEATVSKWRDNVFSARIVLHPQP
ncbi:MAG TPA: hypothetical protein VND45_02880 [Thermoanaerobaculia bacterium]|nr:hypothetical protein [Thermoanaerobaculia bacterium]